MTAATVPQLVTLPEVAVRTSRPLDKLRHIARSHLMPANLVRKVGSTWIASVTDLDAIAEAYDAAFAHHGSVARAANTEG